MRVKAVIELDVDNSASTCEIMSIIENSLPGDCSCLKVYDFDESAPRITNDGVSKIIKYYNDALVDSSDSKKGYTDGIKFTCDKLGIMLGGENEDIIDTVIQPGTITEISDVLGHECDKMGDNIFKLKDSYAFGYISGIEATLDVFDIDMDDYL